MLNSAKLLAICSVVALSFPNNSLASFKASSFFTTAACTAGFASTFKSFLANSVLASVFVTSASEATCVNSFLAAATSFSSFVAVASLTFCSSAFLASNFLSKAWVLASVTTWLNACTACAWASTSACVAASLANTALAAANASFAAATAVLSASWADFNFSSNVAILAFKISFLAVATLGASFATSAFGVTSVFGASAPTFSDTAEATLSLVVSTTGFTATLGSSFNFSPEFVALSTVVLFDKSSLAWATAPAPKNILAPITTDAVPTLNFLIEYDSTFVPCLVSFKYWLFLLTIYSSLVFNTLDSNSLILLSLYN